MSIGQRLETYISEVGITQEKFALKSGVSRQTLNNAINGKYETRGDILAKIVSAFPDLNARWLLTGEGEMYSLNQSTGSIIKNIVSEPVAEYRNKMSQLENENSRLKDELIRCKSEMIEVLKKR